MVKFFFKVWVLVAALLLVGYFGNYIIFDLFMVWVFTFSEYQILFGVFLFVTIFTASVMVYLKKIGFLT